MNEMVKPALLSGATPLAPAGQPTQTKGAAQRRRWPAAAIGLILLLAAIGGGTWWWSRSEPHPEFLTIPVARGPVERSVSATGTVNPELTIIVGSYVSGVIQQLFCDYNTKVSAGQVCAKIDPRQYQSVVNQARANLAVAKAQLEKDRANLAYAKANHGRNSSLAARQIVSQDTADNARSVYEQAEAQISVDLAAIDQRQAELEAASVNLGYTDIISPVDGTVVSRNVTQGQTVAASFQTPTLFLIATDLTKMQVDTNVSESDIGGIHEGAQATFTVDAFPNRVFRGSVSQVRQSPQTVQNVVTYDAVVSVDNRDLALKPGMTASTRIVVERKGDALRVPNAALRFAPQGTATEQAGASQGGAATGRVWLLADGTPKPVSVQVGLESEGFTEIVSGEIGPGDNVIIGERRAERAAFWGLAASRR